jgi:protein-serine/threonine kinase
MVQVEVTPSSFLKIKLLGKGDVGKVYLVREKKTSKLFAMKGDVICLQRFMSCQFLTVVHSNFQKGNDRKAQGQASYN